MVMFLVVAIVHFVCSFQFSNDRFTVPRIADSESLLLPRTRPIVAQSSRRSAGSEDMIVPSHWIVPEGVSFGSLDKLKLCARNSDNSARNRDENAKLCTVATRAIGLNFADVFCLLGLYSAANQVRGTADFCPGLEYSGVIVDDPTGTYCPGQRVLGFTRFGAFSDIVQVPHFYLYPLPDRWTFVQGAGFLVQALTAWHGLVQVGHMPLVDKETTYITLIHSAAGGVGLWAAEIAARRGAVVIGLVGSADKVKVFEDRILPLSPRSCAMIRGTEGTFGPRLASLLGRVYDCTIPTDIPTTRRLSYLRDEGKGVDIVMESLGGKYFTESLEALNRGGSLVTFGSTSYVNPGLNINKIRLIWRYLTRPRIDPGILTSRNIQLAGFNLIYLTDKPEELRRELCDLIGCLNGMSAIDTTTTNHVLLDGVTPPIIGDVFDFRTGAIEALERLKSGNTVGKVVLDNSYNDGN